MRMRLGGIGVLALLAAVGIALLAASPAAAYVDGGCSARFGGIKLDGLPPDPTHAITVGRDDVVPMSMTGVGNKNFDNLTISLVFPGHNWDVYNESASGGTWSKNVDVHSFAKYGVGLYELDGVGTFTDGTTCSGSVMIHVDGDPLRTVAGIAGISLAGLGAAGVLTAGVASGGGGSGPGGSYTQQDATKDEERERTDNEIAEAETEGPGALGWCFLFGILALPLLLLFGSSAALMAVVVPAGVKVRRKTWPLIVGPISGLLAGLGAGVLLQEYAVVYPTRTYAIIYVAGGILFGLAVPWLRRTLSR